MVTPITRFLQLGGRFHIPWPFTEALNRFLWMDYLCLLCIDRLRDTSFFVNNITRTTVKPRYIQLITMRLIYMNLFIRIHNNIYTCDLNTFNIHTYNRKYNVETHTVKTTKALFIWHEKNMAPLVCALRCRLYSRSSLLICKDFSLLSFSPIFFRWYSST